MIDIIIPLMGFFFGGLTGYAIHYFYYEHSDRLTKLENKNHVLLKKNKNLETENESIQHENVLLRQESQKVLEDNREYQDIIAQLSIYARQLKKVKGKMTELEEIITVYEEDIHQRIHNISETNAYDKEKKEYPINQKKF